MSNEIELYMKLLNIACPKCLDTKILWKQRNNVHWARLDGKGDYELLHCTQCSDGKWIQHSWTNMHAINNIPIFHIDHDNMNGIHKVGVLKKIIVRGVVQEHQDQQSRIQQEKEERKDDAKPLPLWDYYKEGVIKTHADYGDVYEEMDMIIQKLCTEIAFASGNVPDLIDWLNQIVADIKSSSSYEGRLKKEWKEIPSTSGRFKTTYVYLKIKYQRRGKYCFCIDCTEKQFIVEYMILKPRNIAAKHACDSKLAERANI
jgi:DNA-directed RNA polymerase subunit RPC12/RpoP